MAFDIKDQLKQHKKILLPGLGLLLLAGLMGILSTKGVTPFSFDSNITDLSDTSKTNISKPTMQLKNNVDYKAVIKTSKGDITIDLFEKDTPKTVNNFVYLADAKFYDNLTFHRIIKDFMIQGGDPLGTGSGGPGYKFDDEIDAQALGLNDIKVKDTTYLSSFFAADVLNTYANKSVMYLYEKNLGYDYTKGYGTTKFAPFVLAMANSGPNTNGSQFFITSRNFVGNYLNGKHTIFGRVTDGFSVVDSIENVSTDQNGAPNTKVVIKSIQILDN
jgi:cyclophilin family peptidyl-prolyl cis-trans isomerase